MRTSPSSGPVREISRPSILAEQERLIVLSNVPPERSAERLTLRHTWRPWTRFRIGPVFSSVGVCLRCKLRIAARIALPLMVLSGMAELSYAQEVDATWASTPITSDWNTAENWRPTQGPLIVPTGTATFSLLSPIKSITFSALSTSVGALSFTEPDYSFTLAGAGGRELQVTGDGIQAATTAVAPSFDVSNGALHFINSSTAGLANISVENTSNVTFNLEDRTSQGSAKAGTAIITAGIAGSADDGTGGFVQFFGHSTADHAAITAFVGSNIEFHDSSSAGNATLIVGNPTLPVGATDNGFLFFNDTATAGHANITVNPGGDLDFSDPFFGGGTATAGNATITSLGTITGPGGTIEFHDRGTAGTATITTTSNFTTTNFFDTSTAENATINITPGHMNFFNNSSAGAASIHVDELGSVAFNDGSTAGTAKIIAGDMGSTDDFTGGFIFFEGNSTADHATITALGDSNIEFDNASSAGHATLTAGNATRPAGSDTNGFIFFSGTSTADHATIIVNEFAQLFFSPLFAGGGTATAGNANITNNADTSFFQGSTAGNATITTNAGGVTSFFGESTGGNATLVTNASGIVDISGLGTFPDGGSVANVPGMTAGSIAGAGTYDLGSKQLTVGSNNSSTIVSGTIKDGGAAGGVGGSLVKVGTGTLTIDGAGTYTGGTTVSGGALVVGDFANPSAALSGGGPISVGSGGTLGGYGGVIGDVTNSGVIASGSAAPGLSGSPMGAFTIKGNYTGVGGTMAINTVLGGDASPSDRLIISGGTASGNTIVHVTNVGGVGAETTNGIPVVNAISGATTTPGAFALPAGELRAGAFDYDLLRGGISGASPNDWFLRSDFVGAPTTPEPPVTPPVVLPIPPFPADPPPNPLPPGVAFPIIGPELATYGVVQPLARQLGLSILGTLDDRVGDTYEPDGCAVAPGVASAAAETSAVDLPTKKPAAVPTRKPGPAPCPLFSPSVWGRFFGQTIHNNYQAFADPSANGDLGGFQGGIDLLHGSLIAGQARRARRPLWRLWRRARRRERPGHQSGGDGLCPQPHLDPMNLPTLVVGGRLLDAYRARRLVSRRRAARDLVLRLGQHPVRKA